MYLVLLQFMFLSSCFELPLSPKMLNYAWTLGYHDGARRFRFNEGRHNPEKDIR